ncbi:MAG: hypothetical protein A2W26_11870 [Acidobacteria bacterium RBG_16_64_8]|nr:MAG: hypothetical protein A2W26_11870 [Acidobacteria bacterium RBG_16_64_8]
MKILWAVCLSLLVLLAVTLGYRAMTQDSLPAQARRILAQEPRFARVTVTLAFDDVVVLGGATRTVEESWDARNAIWFAWTGTPRPAGVLNHIRADVPPHDPQSHFNHSQDLIPKVIAGKDGRLCTPGSAIITHSPLMVIPSCDGR